MRRTPIIHTLRSDGTYTTAAALASDTGATPTFARNCVAYRDYWDGSSRKLVEVAANVPRWCTRKDGSGNLHSGLLVEQDGTNYTVQSGVAGWSVTRCALGDSAVATPAGGVMQKLVEEYTVLSARWANSEQFAATNGQLYIHSFFCKALSRGWVCGDFGTNVSGYQLFNLATGEFGVGGNRINAKGVEPWAPGVYRCWQRLTMNASANLYPRILPAVSGASADYEGVAGTDAIAVWGSQIEASATGFPSSLIATTAAAATRLGEVVSYNITGRIGQRGSLLFDVMFPNQDLASDVVLATLHDGTANNRIIVSALASGDKLSTQVISGGVEQANITDSTTDICDGNKHTIAINFAPNFVRQCVDGVAEGTVDTSATIPSGLTTLTLADYAGANQCGGLISDLKLYNRPGVTS